MRSIISRRAAMAAGLGAATLLTGATPASASARPASAATPDLEAAVQFLGLMLDAHYSSGLRLPQSHADEVGLYTTGFTYDSALAVLALLAHHKPDSTARAQVIGDALGYAEAHDPKYHDGRLRQAYHTGPYTRGGVEQPYGLIRPDGTANIGGAFVFTGSGTGAQAWAGLALCALHRRTGDPGYLASAVRLGTWIVTACRSTGPLGGFTVGADRHGNPLTAVSTSYNAVILAFLGQLYAATADMRWMTDQQVAVQLVHRMWSEERRCYLRGSATGSEVLTDIVTLEAQTLTGLAMPGRRATAALAVARHDLTVTDDPSRPNSAVSESYTGLTFSTASRTANPQTPIEDGLPKPDPSAVWLEGTAQFAAALRRTPDPGTAAAPLAEVARAQANLGRGQHAGDRPIPVSLGVVAATSPLHVGVDASGYYPFLHIASTAWLVIAAAGTNPLYSDYS